MGDFVKQIVREYLTRLIWDSGIVRSDYVFTYVCRGEVGDRAEFSGDQVIKVGKSYVVIQTSTGLRSIPLHRIVEIRYRGRVVWRSPRF